MVRSIPPTSKRAPPPRPREGLPHFTDENSEAETDDLSRQDSCPERPVCVRWVLNPPTPPPRRTAPTSCPRSAASPPASAASLGGGPGGGRGGTFRAARWPPGLVVHSVLLPVPRAPPGLHLPGGYAERQPTTGPPLPALRSAGLKGDAARLGALRVAPALAPPRFPAPHPSPSSVPQP